MLGRAGEAWGAESGNSRPGDDPGAMSAAGGPRHPPPGGSGAQRRSGGTSCHRAAPAPAPWGERRAAPLGEHSSAAGPPQGARPPGGAARSAVRGNMECRRAAPRRSPPRGSGAKRRWGEHGAPQGCPKARAPRGGGAKRRSGGGTQRAAGPPQGARPPASGARPSGGDQGAQGRPKALAPPAGAARSAARAEHTRCRSTLDDRPASGLDLSALDLGIDPAALRAARRPGRPALQRHRCGAVDQCLQARQRIVAIAVLAPVALGLDDDDAFIGDPLIVAEEQAILDRIGQRRGADVEAQVQRCGHLVDILPTRALRADCRPFDLGRVDGDHHARPGNGRPAIIRQAAVSTRRSQSRGRDRRHRRSARL